METPDYRLGRFTLKPFRQLLDGGVPVQIGRKPLELLSVLAKAEGALVTKDELMAAVWPKSIVEENVIQVHIAALRKTLGKDAELLSTVHGLGYRLTVVPESSAAGGMQSTSPAKGVAGLRWRLPLVALAATLIIAIAIGSYWRSSPDANAVSTAGAPLNAKLAPAVHAAPITIAVLPFDNLSGDPGQQFFSDGMTEEISAALAKVPRLQLVARTSAFQFRGKKDAREVGKALGADYVIEGSVRRAKNRVRITTHLIRTDIGRSVWNDSYDRELTDVFAIQEDIATAVAEALRLSLGLAPGENLVSNRDIDPDSYEKFLRAKPLVRGRSTGTAQGIQILEPLVARNPEYAPAWALLALSYSMMPAFVSPYTTVPGQPAKLQRRQRIAEFWPKAEAAARRAIVLDPKLSDGYVALGLLMHVRGNLAASDDLLAKALTLDRNNPDALGLRLNLLADVGELGKARESAEKLLELEPYVPTWIQDAAELFWEVGQDERAIQLLTPLMKRPSVPSSLAMMFASQRRYAEAADVMDAALKERGEMVQGQSTMWRKAVVLLRTAPSPAAFGQGFPRLGRVGFVFLHVGAPEQALQIYEDEVKTGLVGGQGNTFSYLWHPSFAGVRRTQRFKNLMKNSGMVDYWQQRGWPEFCRPTELKDFACN